MAGISLAPDDTALTATPTWERIDDDYNVQSWSVHRGRANEMSKTGTGTATIQLVDRTGDFDPTNNRPLLRPPHHRGTDGAWCRRRSNYRTRDHTWSTPFRGLHLSIQWVPYRTEQHANVTIGWSTGWRSWPRWRWPGRQFGHAVIDGNIVYNEDAGLDAVKTRIGKVLDEVGWPGALRSIFTGNVSLQKTTYAPRSTALSVIEDAADAEFPTLANVYIGGPHNPGYVVFHGRYARFNPDDVAYGIRVWLCGDDTVALTDTSIVGSRPLVASAGRHLLYTCVGDTAERR
jgi:hypothetical protein